MNGISRMGVGKMEGDLLDSRHGDARDTRICGSDDQSW